MRHIVAFLLLATSFAKADTQCLNYNAIYDQADDQCYLYNSTPTAYLVAEKYCNDNYGHLSTISNGFQNAFVSEFAQVMFPDNFWIGFTSLKTGNSWEWLDGKPVTYTNWKGNTPRPDGADQCVDIVGVSGEWQASLCSDHKSFVCTVPKSGAYTSTQRPPQTTTGWWNAVTTTRSWLSVASTTGWWNPASSTGWRNPASTTGWWNPASSTGWWNPASSTGWWNPASTTGWWNPASTTGWWNPKSTTGWWNPASTTGWWNPKSTTGWWNPASSTGWWNSATTASNWGSTRQPQNGGSATTASPGKVMQAFNVPHSQHSPKFTSVQEILDKASEKH